MAVYFMQPVDGGPIKIGVTFSLATRHKALEQCYGRKLVILATIEGDEAKEREIHGRFAHLRLTGKAKVGRLPEQFVPAPELMAFIGLPPSDKPSLETIVAMDPIERVPRSRRSQRTQLVGDGTVLAANLVRLGYAGRRVSPSRVARAIFENTGEHFSIQRIAGLLNSIRISPVVINRLAKGLGVNPKELTKRAAPKGKGKEKT